MHKFPTSADFSFEVHWFRKTVSYQRLIHGITRIRGHCLFAWTETVDSRPLRTYEIAPAHCEACVSELKRLHPGAAFIAATEGAMHADDGNRRTPPRGGPRRR